MRLIEEVAVPVKIAANESPNREIVERFFHVWTPHQLLLDAGGRIGHEWVGFLPPTLYMAELQLGVGVFRLRQRRFEEAGELLARVRDDHPRSHVADAAAYWAAVARYQASGEGLQAGWDILRRRYPESVWRTKVLFYEIEQDS